MKWNLLTLTAACLLLTAAASAQKSEIRANVPFDFIIDGATLPAGEYSLESVGAGGTVLAIRSANSRIHSMFMVKEDQASHPDSWTKLVFHRYGDRYFLAEIRVAGNTLIRQVPQTRREKELAMKNSTNAVVLNAASR